jgi:sensor histidine kinase YesM
MRKILFWKYRWFRFAIHLLFWLVSFYIILLNHSSSSEILRIDIIYSSVFLIAPLAAVYFNLYFLIPRYFQKGKYLQYIIFLILIVLAGAGIHRLSYDYLIGMLFKDYYLISYIDIWQIARSIIIFVGITTLAHLSMSWFELHESKAKLQEVEKEKALFQLESLKAQINPHFLFNSLNSIYSLALNKSQQTPDIILQLSDVLRYVIYDSNAEKVDLINEIGFIKNYIDLQKLRTNISEAVIFNIEGEPADKKIAPLIFIVFIENAFKHGLKGDIKNQFISINLIVRDDSIEFNCENNTGQTSEIKSNEYNGLGLENVKKRLDLMYKDSYNLEIVPGKVKFSVRLKINL